MMTITFWGTLKGVGCCAWGLLCTNSLKMQFLFLFHAQVAFKEGTSKVTHGFWGTLFYGDIYEMLIYSAY